MIVDEASQCGLLVRVNSYLADAKDQRVIWGQSDCTAWARKWVESAHGRNMRLPTYSSRGEALKHIARAGSLEALWGPALDEYGLLERFSEPLVGDVGIINTHLAGQVGGIFLNHGLFAWRSDPGCRVLLPRVKTIVKVWALQ